MSITTLEPLTPNAPVLTLHEDIWTEENQVPSPSHAGKKFPAAVRTRTAQLRQRCIITPVEEPEERLPAEPATHTARWAPDEPDTDQYFVPPEVRPVIDKIFPKTDSLANLEVSVGTVVHAVAPALLEVLAGARPARQLVGVLNPECMGKLEHHVVVGRSQQPDPANCCYSNPRVLRIRISQILPRVFEAAVILLDIHSVRATALRVELWHGRWQVTAMEIG